jgi:anti-sigma factor RsiW
MDNSDRELLMRALGNEGSAEERNRLAELLARKPELRPEWEQMQQVQRLLEDSRSASFRPFFASRVMRRIEARSRATAADILADGLLWLFRPLVPLTLVLTALVAWNNWNNRELLAADPTALEVIFAVPPTTLETTYALDM